MSINMERAYGLLKVAEMCAAHGGKLASLGAEATAELMAMNDEAKQIQVDRAAKAAEEAAKQAEADAKAKAEQEAKDAKAMEDQAKAYAKDPANAPNLVDRKI